MKPMTVEKIEADLAKHRKARERGTAGPYTEHELRLTRLNVDYGSASYESDRRAFNAALRDARRSLVR